MGEFIFPCCMDLESIGRGITFLTYKENHQIRGFSRHTNSKQKSHHGGMLSVVLVVKNYNLFGFKYLLVTAYYNPNTGNGKQQATIWKSVMGLKEILRNSSLQMIGD